MTAGTYKAGYKNSWALVIGINTYEHVPPLAYACNDADAIANVLTSLGFPENQVIVLKDAKATKERILESYLDFHRIADDPDDRVLVFFAGHGHTLRGSHGPIGYLIPVDGKSDRPSTLIRWDDLTRNADLVVAKHILFVMDACYSGLAMQRVAAPGGQRFLSDMLQRPARQVITAGKADETVADGGGPHGENSIFTAHLVDGLSGMAANKDGILTANGLMHYVYEKVGQDNRSNQTPHYGHIDGDGDFVLLTPGLKHLGTNAFSDVLIETSQEKPEPIPALEPPETRLSYASKLGYTDPDHANFARNDLSQYLGEHRYADGSHEIVRAFSWLAVVAEPLVNQPVSIDIGQKAQRLDALYEQGSLPFEKFHFPFHARTSLNSLILYDSWNNSNLWSRYLRITKQGNIEYVETKNTFFELAGKRYFKFVQIAGVVWQLLFFTKSLLKEVDYKSTVRLTVGLVGTRSTILADFSHEPGYEAKYWRDPLKEAIYFDDNTLSRISCHDANLKLQYDLPIGNLNEVDSVKVVRDLGQQLGLAYNHQSSPRCFNCDTEDFPWKQYVDDRRF